MQEVTITLDQSGVGTILLHQPEKRNVLSKQIMLELERIILEIGQYESKCKVLIIRSKHPHFFSAGGDVREWVTYEKLEAFQEGWAGARIFRLIEDLPIPTIAAISGSCFGGGCELALACDLRIATSDAKFGQPEILLGNGPSWGGYYRLVRKIGITRAKEMILLGDTYSAEQAEGFGLVNRVVSDWDVLLETIERLAKQLVMNHDTAIVSKLILNQMENEIVGTNFVVDALSAAYFAGTEISKLRKQAFLEKRLSSILEAR